MFYEAVILFSVRVFSAARRQIGRSSMRLKPRIPKSELAHVRMLLSEAGGRNKVLVCASGLTNDTPDPSHQTVKCISCCHRNPGNSARLCKCRTMQVIQFYPFRIYILGHTSLINFGWSNHRVTQERVEMERSFGGDREPLPRELN